MVIREPYPLQQAGEFAYVHIWTSSTMPREEYEYDIHEQTSADYVKCAVEQREEGYYVTSSTAYGQYADVTSLDSVTDSRRTWR